MAATRRVISGCGARACEAEEPDGGKHAGRADSSIQRKFGTRSGSDKRGQDESRGFQPLETADLGAFLAQRPNTSWLWPSFCPHRARRRHKLIKSSLSDPAAAQPAIDARIYDSAKAKGPGAQQPKHDD